MTEEVPEGPYFHGTHRELKPGDRVLPPRSTGHEPRWGEDYPNYRPDLVYMTNLDFHAGTYALKSAQEFGGEAHVYEVRPAEPKRDPEYFASGGFGSDQVVASEAEVVREVPKEQWWVERRHRHLAARDDELLGRLDYRYRDISSAGEEQHAIYVFDKENPDTGDEEPVAHISWAPDADGIHRVMSVEVGTGYKRRGLATHLWQRAQEMQPGLEHDYGGLLPEGKRWVRSLAAAGDQVFYHLSPASNRSSIEERGLDYRAGKSPWAGTWLEDRFPKGNYLHSDRGYAEMARESWLAAGNPIDMWEVRLPEGHPLDEDVTNAVLPGTPKAYLSGAPISPERMRRVAHTDRGGSEEEHEHEVWPTQEAAALKPRPHTRDVCERRRPKSKGHYTGEEWDANVERARREGIATPIYVFMGPAGAHIADGQHRTQWAVEAGVPEILSSCAAWMSAASGCRGRPGLGGTIPTLPAPAATSPRTSSTASTRAQSIPAVPLTVASRCARTSGTPGAGPPARSAPTCPTARWSAASPGATTG